MCALVAAGGATSGVGGAGHVAGTSGDVAACGGLLNRGCGWRRERRGGNSSAGAWRKSQERCGSGGAVRVGAGRGCVGARKEENGVCVAACGGLLGRGGGWRRAGGGGESSVSVWRR